ncbi:MAG: helix-turn-helix domain-containing protein [Bacteroidales bacterium]|nr:helix-turn-helix domain-containing protein [Bacteroidales bacterium]
MVNLNQRVKELRVKKGMTQELLAENSGLSLRTIQRIENGVSLPRGDTLKRLAISLQVSPDDIIDWKIIEDKNVLFLLNSSQFGFLVFPLLGIIIPLAIWILKKDKIKNIDEVGKSILNFQISWTILLSIFFILLIVFPYIEFLHNTNLNIFLVIGILYIYNSFIIMINTILCQRGKKIFYLPAIKFLH